MASLVLSGDTSGSITVAAPAVAGSNTQTLVAATGTLTPIVSDTVKTATGTSVDFTGIPSWVRRITVMFSGVSLSGTDSFLIQLGDSGGLETTGYVGGGVRIGGIAVNGLNFTTGFGFNNTTAGVTFGGTFTIVNVTGNTWVASGVISGNATEQGNLSSGTKTLSATLDRLSVTRSGTNTFTAGSINIIYE
jgi:hypothetical protein